MLRELLLVGRKDDVWERKRSVGGKTEVWEERWKCGKDGSVGGNVGREDGQ